MTSACAITKVISYSIVRPGELFQCQCRPHGLHDLIGRMYGTNANEGIWALSKHVFASWPLVYMNSRISHVGFP